jgi:hypothetical protein
LPDFAMVSDAQVKLPTRRVIFSSGGIKLILLHFINCANVIWELPKTTVASAAAGSAPW